MSDAAQAIERRRIMAFHLVEHERRQWHGQKMPAYEAVASQIKASASWLRKFLGGHPGAALSFEVGFQIRAAYDRLCERVEAAQETERAKLEAVRRALDAADESDHRLVATVAREGGSGPAASPAQGNPEADS